MRPVVVVVVFQSFRRCCFLQALLHSLVDRWAFRELDHLVSWSVDYLVLSSSSRAVGEFRAGLPVAERAPFPIKRETFWCPPSFGAAKKDDEVEKDEPPDVADTDAQGSDSDADKQVVDSSSSAEDRL